MRFVKTVSASDDIVRWLVEVAGVIDRVCRAIALLLLDDGGNIFFCRWGGKNAGAILNPNSVSVGVFDLSASDQTSSWDKSAAQIPQTLPPGNGVCDGFETPPIDVGKDVISHIPPGDTNDTVASLFFS